MIDWSWGLMLLAVTGAGGMGATSGEGATRHAASSRATTASEPVVACRMNALNAKERERHGKLLASMMGQVTAVDELKSGYRFRLNDAAALPLVAEWMTLERRCCPFFTFGLEWSETQGTTLTLSGPPGSKELIAAAMLSAREETGETER